MSYLLFQDSFTRELIALGYQDAMKRSDDLLAFLGGFTVDRFVLMRSLLKPGGSEYAVVDEFGFVS